MIAFFYESVRKQKRAGKKYWPILYKINKLFLNLLYPFFQRFKGTCGVNEQSNIIVSLTSYPARIGTVWITIASLLNQTMKPYKVILWLAQEQFPDKKVPTPLAKLQKRGLEIRYCEDLKPHKKYFYTMQEYLDYYVITADDDIFYPENHIEQLWKGYEKYPESVICHWSHKVSFDAKGNFTQYDTWENNVESKPSHLTLAVGCNGVLYPPHSLAQEAFDKKKIEEYAMLTDDLWLKCMEVLNDKKVVNCNETVLIYFNILAAQKSGLWKQNTGHARNNDNVWEKLMKLYPQVKEKMLNE